MAFLRYWRSVAWMAARHSLDHTQTILFVGFLILGAAAYFVPALRPMMISESGWAAAAGALGGIILLRLLLAPYWLDQEKSDRIKELEKIDRQDLQHMLNGRFLGNTFMYGDEWTLCKQYKSSFELERLKNRFDTIKVRAPKNSFVKLRFQYLNGHEGLGPHAFYIRGAVGPENLIDIYQPPEICLDDQCSFSLKLACDDAYQFNESASLLVGIETGTK